MIGGGWARYSETLESNVVVSESCELYSVDAQGDVFFEGLCTAPGGSGMVVDAPFFVGKTWDYCLLGACFTTEITGQESVTVPGGTYLAYVQEIRGEAGDLLSTNWVVDGVGYVKMEGLVRTWVLFQAVVDDEDSSWGAVKSLYR